MEFNFKKPPHFKWVDLNHMNNLYAAHTTAKQVIVFIRSFLTDSSPVLFYFYSPTTCKAATMPLSSIWTAIMTRYLYGTAFHRLMARVLYFPTLIRLIFKQKVSITNWYDRIDDTVILGALPFRSMTKEVINCNRQSQYIHTVLFLFLSVLSGSLLILCLCLGVRTSSWHSFRTIFISFCCLSIAVCL